MDKTQRTNLKFYDAVAERWSNSHTNSFWHEKPFRAFAKILPNGARVLDVGAASGIHVPLFLGIGRKLTYQGLDISRKFLKIARARYPQLPFVYGNILDARTLPKKSLMRFGRSQSCSTFRLLIGR